MTLVKAEGSSCIPLLSASAAFAAVLIVFAVQTTRFSSATVEWARRNLDAQAELAARTLAVPLHEQDFKRLREFGESCRCNGLEFRVSSPAGGVVFDTRSRLDADGVRMLSSSRASGEYLISLFLPYSRVNEPFVKAVPSLVLSALLGAAGMFVLFFALDRQRARIRELKRLEKFRRDFTADVSHEIKTPLTGLIAASEMLPEACDNPRASELSGIIAKESHRLDTLVQRILDLSRLECDGGMAKISEVDLESLLGPLAESCGSKFSVSADVGIVRCDPFLVSEAVDNLLRNAFKHSGSKDVFLSVDRDGKRVEISVEDHGVGIAEEYRQRVFERFFRADPSRAAETGGAGLGLAIVRRIAHLHGGEVRLCPVDPSGCRFVFSFESGSAGERVNKKGDRSDG